MKITYTLTEEDYAHAQRWLTRRKIPILIPLAIVFGAILCVMSSLFFKIGLLMWRRSVSEALFNFVVAPALFGYGIYLFMYFTQWNLRRAVVQRNKKVQGLIGERTMTVSPEWLQETSNVKDVKASWATVQQFGQDNGYLYFIVEGNMVHVAPRRAFATPDDAERFLATAQAYWNAARNGTSPPIDIEEDGKTWPPAPRTL